MRTFISLIAKALFIPEGLEPEKMFSYQQMSISVFGQLQVKKIDIWSFFSIFLCFRFIFVLGRVKLCAFPCSKVSLLKIRRSNQVKNAYDNSTEKDNNRILDVK